MWRSVTLRVKIVKALAGAVDGVNLAQFELDGIYELGPTFAGYLLTAGLAVPADDVHSRADDETTGASGQPSGTDAGRPARVNRPRRTR
jgi:hypothetical protein